MGYCLSARRKLFLRVCQVFSGIIIVIILYKEKRFYMYPGSFSLHQTAATVGAIQQLRRQEGVGRWSIKCLRGLDRYSKNQSKMSTFVYKG